MDCITRGCKSLVMLIVCSRLAKLFLKQGNFTNVAAGVFGDGRHVFSPCVCGCLQRTRSALELVWPLTLMQHGCAQLTTISRDSQTVNNRTNNKSTGSCSRP